MKFNCIFRLVASELAWVEKYLSALDLFKCVLCFHFCSTICEFVCLLIMSQDQSVKVSVMMKANSLLVSCHRIDGN